MPSMPEDPGGQTSTLKATKSAPLGPHPGAAPLPPPGLGVIKHDRGRGSSPGTTPSLRAPSSPGWGTHTTGLPDVRGSQEIQGGPPPQSTFRKGHLLRSPSPPGATLGLPGVDAPRLWPCLALSLSVMLSRSVCVSLTPLCGRVDSAVCPHHVQLAHVSADTGWPHRLAAANPAAVNVRVSVWMWTLTSLGHVPGSGIAGSLVTLSLAV